MVYARGKKSESPIILQNIEVEKAGLVLKKIYADPINPIVPMMVNADFVFSLWFLAILSTLHQIDYIHYTVGISNKEVVNPYKGNQYKHAGYNGIGIRIGILGDYKEINSEG